MPVNRFRESRTFPISVVALSLDTDFRFFLPQCLAFVAGKFSPIRTLVPTGQKSEVLFSATLQQAFFSNEIGLTAGLSLPI